MGFGSVLFDEGSRKAIEYIIDGYAHTIFGGNTVTTHDECTFGTALGQMLSREHNVMAITIILIQ